MKTVLKCLVGAVLSLNLVACGMSENESSSSTGYVNQSEYLRDTETLNSAEKSLEAVGLIIETSYGDNKIIYSWKQSAYQDYLVKAMLNDNLGRVESDVTAALNNYVSIAKAYMRKYSGSNHHPEIETKTKLAEETISIVKNMRL